MIWTRIGFSGILNPGSLPISSPHPPPTVPSRPSVNHSTERDYVRVQRRSGRSSCSRSYCNYYLSPLTNGSTVLSIYKGFCYNTWDQLRFLLCHTQGFPWNQISPLLCLTCFRFSLTFTVNPRSSRENAHRRDSGGVRRPPKVNVPVGTETQGGRNPKDPSGTLTK